MYSNDIYEMEVWENDPVVGVKCRSFPCYTCGHCSSIIALREDRFRERKRCFSCGRLICEKSQLCNTHCTPLHKLANDGFEGKGEWVKYVPAIMAGMTTKEEALEKGLVKE